MASTSFVLKYPKSNNETLVYLLFRYNNKTYKTSTGEKIHPKNWNKRTQRAREQSSSPEFPEFNSRLEYIKNVVNTVYRKYLTDNDNQAPTREKLKELVDIALKRSNSNDTPQDFIGYFEDFIEKSKRRTSPATGKLIGEKTIKKYRTTLKYIQDFQIVSKRRVDFDTIDLEFYYDFVNYLASDLDLAVNTIGQKHIQTIKVILNDATENGVNKNLAYRNNRFRCISEEAHHIYLNETELAEIYNLDLSNNERLDKVRDLFILGCWTGLRFSDLHKINPENINGEILTIETEKTSTRVSIPIFPIVKNIVQKYANSGNMMPKVPSNQKMNAYLKEICLMAKSLDVPILKTITKGGCKVSKQLRKYNLVTTHTARRSFATNLYNSGYPSIGIMKVTGHKTERAFLKYIKITEEENAKKLQEHWQKSESYLKIAE